jgi:hypothetical protein
MNRVHILADLFLTKKTLYELIALLVPVVEQNVCIAQNNIKNEGVKVIN